MTVSVSEAVRVVVESEPCLRECLSMGIVSFRRLARRIKPLVEGIVGRECSVESIKTALMRYSARLPGAELVGRSVAGILSRSFVEGRTGVSVVTASVSAMQRIPGILEGLVGRTRFMALVQSPSAITFMVDDEHYRMLLDELAGADILYSSRGNAALTIVSPREIINTPGVIAYITGLLAKNNINILQFTSCHTDTILVMSERDLLKAMDVLSRAINLSRQVISGK